MRLGIAPPRARQFGLVNWRGVWSLYRRGQIRFLRYGVETIAGPAITSLMFLAIFQLLDVASGLEFVAHGEEPPSQDAQRPD